MYIVGLKHCKHIFKGAKIKIHLGLLAKCQSARTGRDLIIEFQ
jgi:hypothetical protein